MKNETVARKRKSRKRKARKFPIPKTAAQVLRQLGACKSFGGHLTPRGALRLARMDAVRLRHDIDWFLSSIGVGIRPRATCNCRGCLPDHEYARIVAKRLTWSVVEPKLRAKLRELSEIP